MLHFCGFKLSNLHRAIKRVKTAVVHSDEAQFAPIIHSTTYSTELGRVILLLRSQTGFKFNMLL